MPMTSRLSQMFVAFRAIFFASAFLGFWTWLAISVRRYDDQVHVSMPQWVRSAGVLLAIGGAILTVSCIATFVVRGRGTPAPFDPPRAFVAAGPYRFVRNPMYIGGIAVLLGAGLFLSSPSILVLSMIAFALAHLLVVLYEEPALTRRFGDSYLRYKKAVPRWLVGRRR